MKVKTIVETTTNRGEFNRAYKRYLEHRVNGIRCTYCRYHKGENKTTKWYGGWEDESLRYPNWKLVSKNRKQWMQKNLNFTEKKSRFSKDILIDITW